MQKTYSTLKLTSTLPITCGLPAYFMSIIKEMAVAQDDTEAHIIRDTVNHFIRTDLIQDFHFCYRKHVSNQRLVNISIAFNQLDFLKFDNFKINLEKIVKGVRIYSSSLVCLALWNEIPKIRKLYEETYE